MAAVLQILEALQKTTPWLKDFPPPLDATLAEIAAARGRISPRIDDFAHFEVLLRDASKLLDRCLAYRREYLDLAVRAIQASREDAFQDDVNATMRAIDVAAWDEQTREAQSAAQAEVKKVFDASKADLAPGLSASAEAAIETAKAASAANDIRTKLIADKWDKSEAYRAASRELRRSPGSPLAYSERATRIAALLAEDFAEAVDKMLASADGLNRAYGLALDQAVVDADKPLESAVNWTRDAIRSWEALQSVTIEAEVQVLLRQFIGMIAPQPPADGPVIRGPIILAIVFVPVPAPPPRPAENFGELAPIGGAVPLRILGFDLNEAHGFRQGDRISTLSLSIILTNQGEFSFPTMVHATLGVTVPSYVEYGVEAKPFEVRPHVAMSGITVEPPSGGADWCDPGIVRHMPAKGRWAISLDEISYAFGDVPVDWNHVRDIRLHVRVFRKVDEWTPQQRPIRRQDIRPIQD
jgi:hypothetical protein